jgi:ABC-2 type transport system ATP-binding protein
MQPSDLAIRTRGLRKVFNKTVAVDSLTLDVARGEVFGFLGPNGAGKSTSIKMLLGLVAPTSGAAELLGRSIGDVDTRGQIGFLPEHFQFYAWLSASELLHVHGRLYRMSGAQLRDRVPELLELVGLSAHRDKLLRNFSKGMLQRLGLAQALLNHPHLIFLDEPTSGLDPIGRRLVRDVIKAERERGAAVFLNSHLLSEVEITCDRVAFIKQGQVVETINVQTARDSEISVSLRAKKLAPEIIAGLDRWASSVQVEGELIALTVQSAEVLPDLLRYLVSKGVDVYELTRRRMSLEERFLQIVGEDKGL